MIDRLHGEESESHDQSDMYVHLNNGNMRRDTKKSFSPPLKVSNYKMKQEDFESSRNVQTTTKTQQHVITEDQKRTALRHYPAIRSEKDLASSSRITELDQTTKTFNVGKQHIIDEEERKR